MVVVGCQWGDEGKGKVVDLLSKTSDMVVRFQGGANAGHTLHVNNKKIILHLIPSGILNPTCLCVITPGVILDPRQLLTEINSLKENGFFKKDNQLKISSNTTLALDYHKDLDRYREKTQKLGTTLRGIGPAYEDRVSRKAILFGDIFQPKILSKKLTQISEEKNILLKAYNLPAIDVSRLSEDLEKLSYKLKPFRYDDTSKLIHDYHMDGKRILFEGAQGTLLDLYHGTYPYVTSSSTVAGAAMAYSGLGAFVMDEVLGVVKAYCTRVGEGPFPSELKGDTGDELLKKGHEFGSTTGRKRRCGWLDLVALKYAVRLNGITSLALTKLDVLSNFEKLKMLTQYEVDIEKKVKPVFETFEGWSEDLSKIKSKKNLPKKALAYLEFIENFVNVKVSIISVGPGRDETIIC